jgi:hypothetical protein
MEIQIQDDRMNVVYNYIKIIFKENISIDEISELERLFLHFTVFFRRPKRLLNS